MSRCVLPYGELPSRRTGHNPVGVGGWEKSFPQGSSCLATLGWRPQPRWGCPASATLTTLSRNQDAKTWKHTPEIRFISGQQAIEPFCKTSNENVGHRTFGDAEQPLRLHIAMPASVCCQCLGSGPSLRPGDLQVVEKEFLPGHIASEHRSKFDVGGWCQHQPVAALGAQQRGGGRSELRRHLRCR